MLLLSVEISKFKVKKKNPRNLIGAVQSSSWPVECSTSDLGKLLIEGVKEPLQLSHHGWVHLWVDAALAACQALVKHNVKSQTVKSPGGVEVQIILADPRREVEKAFNELQLRQRVRDQAVPVHNVELLHWKELQPAFQMFSVDAGSNGFVLCVHLTGTGVDGQLLELVVCLVFALFALQHLCVVRHCSGCGLSDDDQQLDGGVHFEDAFRNLLCDEICRAFLNGDLMREGEGHFPSVPVHSPGIVLVIVKEVDFL